MAWEAVHVTHAILLLVTWYLIHSIVLLSATLCHMVSMESVHISSQCLASWGYSWEKRTNGYSFGTRITFFDSCARFNVGSSIHTHLECAHILESFMALRFPVLTGTSSIGWANDGVHNYFLFLGDAHLLRYSQTLGVVMFSIYLNVHMVPPILASRTGFSWSVFHRQLYTGDLRHFLHCAQRLNGERSTVNSCGKMRCAESTSTTHWHWQLDFSFTVCSSHFLSFCAPHVGTWAWFSHWKSAIHAVLYDGDYLRSRRPSSHVCDGTCMTWCMRKGKGFDPHYCAYNLFLSWHPKLCLYSTLATRIVSIWPQLQDKHRPCAMLVLLWISLLLDLVVRTTLSQFCNIVQLNAQLWWRAALNIFRVIQCVKLNQRTVFY